MNYRIAYQGETMVNWCPELGTVLANDEVSEGLSVRGGFPVEQKLMNQWCLRVSAYAPRLLDDLNVRRSKLCNICRFRSKHHKSDTEDGVGAGSEYFQLNIFP